MLGHLRGEEACVESLPPKPTVEVRETREHRVDLASGRPLAKLCKL
jgi:hypothetical protein